MGSSDVIHSFWVPQFAAKRDVFANRETRMWFTAETEGDYPGQCAEFCGIQHGRMSHRIKAQKAEDFQAWVAHMQTLGPKPAAQGAAASRPAPAPQNAEGEKLFTAKGCIACHSLVAVNAPKGMVGPNLANVGARSYIAAGTLKNTDENLTRWIRDPQAIKQGVLMPTLPMTEAEARALAAYLRAQK
jgi:cytochrome c oxidase subunit 2